MPTTREEVISDMRDFVSREYGGDWKRAFEAEDKNNDGRVSRDELIDILAKAGIGVRLTRRTIAAEVIKAMDADADGLIAWDEFKKLIDMV